MLLWIQIWSGGWWFTIGFFFFFFWCKELVSTGVSGGDGLIHEGYFFILLIRTLLY